ncbi:MAG TPA: RidA family protein [Steroidobacter sp.]
MTGLIGQVTTDEAPQPAGHYRQAVVFNGLVYVSGQLGRTPDGRHTSGEPFEVQARQALSNLLAIVNAAGSSRERVLKVTAYLVGGEHWPLFNQVFAEVFGEHRPARTTVPVPSLNQGYLVEIDAIAALKG